MTVERYLRMIAGALILVSLGLSHYCGPPVDLLHDFHWAEPVAVRVYGLVPDDDDPEEAGGEISFSRPMRPAR
jgi:hypothetical protein